VRSPDGKIPASWRVPNFFRTQPSIFIVSSSLVVVS
jgi:hypothetical protein